MWLRSHIIEKCARSEGETGLSLPKETAEHLGGLREQAGIRAKALNPPVAASACEECRT